MAEDYSLYMDERPIYIRRYRYGEYYSTGLEDPPTGIFGSKEGSVTKLNNYRQGGKGRDWRQKIKRHQNATTLLNAEKHRIRGGYGYGLNYYYRNLVKGPTYVEEFADGHICGTPGTPTLLGSSIAADNAAKQAFTKKAKGAITEFSGLTFLGELRETLRMIRNPAKALRKELGDYVSTAMKRARRASRQSRRRVISESWLEWSFGMAPLVSDVKSGGEALNRRLERFAGSYTRVSGQAQVQEYYPPGFYSGPIGQSNLRWRTRVAETRACSIRYYGEVRSVCPNPVQADMRLFGVTWGDVVLTGWELVPWSFLIDYFTNVGDILNAWTLRQSDLAWVSRVQQQKSIRTREILLAKEYLYSAPGGAMAGRPKGYTWSVSPCVHTRTKVDRGASSTNPAAYIPSITWEIPGLSSKWINMSALVGARRWNLRSLP